MPRVILHAIAFVILSLGASCVDEDASANFALQLSIDASPDVDATSILLRPGNVRLHVAGTPRAAGWTPEDLNDSYWTPLATKPESVDLLSIPLEGFVTVAQSSAPAAIYDHIYLEVDELQAKTADGTTIPCKNVIEPIAIELDLLTAQSARVNLELYIAANWPEDGHCSVLAKKASLL